MELGAGVGSHADQVFLAVGRHDAVAGGGPGVHLVLADHGGGGVLRYHESGVEAGVCHQELGESAHAEDELCHASLGDVAELGQGYAHVVEHQRQRLAGEVAGNTVGLSVTELISVWMTLVT